MKVLVAQIGARRHYAVPRALYSQGALDVLVTDACVNLAPWRWLRRVISEQESSYSEARRLNGRFVQDIPTHMIRGLPWFTLSAYWARKGGQRDVDCWARQNRKFCTRVVRDGFCDADTVYAFNGAALEIFESARRRGLRTILDQSSASWRWNTNLLLEERERWPGWEDQPSEIDESRRLTDREEAEWELADRIICGSKFAQDTLIHVGGECKNCTVVPYPGHYNTLSSTPNRESRKSNKGELHVLFVGTLQLRKGLPYLVEALRELADPGIRTRLVGPSKLSGKAMNDVARTCEIVGPVPRSRVREHYAWADVFVFPTLSEGSANVCHEAMGAGLPVITTANAGSAVRDEQDGLLVPIRDSTSLAVAMERLKVDKELRSRLQYSARSCSSSGSISSYGMHLVGAMSSRS